MAREANGRGARAVRTSFSLAALAAVSACTSDHPTEIVAGVSTQIRVPDYLKKVGVVVEQQGRVQFCDVYPVGEAGNVTLPASLGVLSRGASATESVTVQVLGLRSEDPAFEVDCRVVRPDDPEVMVLRRRRLTFVDDRILFLPLPLKESCRDRVCGDGETCVGGACVAMDIEAGSLSEYRDDMLFGETNTCFAADTCLEGIGGFPLPVLLDSIDDCSFSVQLRGELTAPAAGELNVRIHYDSFGTEVLDFDGDASDPGEQEGFGFTDAADPLRFRLAPNLCESNYKQDRILGVEASTRCPAKRALQPLCAPKDGADAGGGASSGQRLCSIDALRPVESAVMVLMDTSSSMSGFFGGGSDDLSQIVGLSLNNPVARRTSVALGAVPASDACAPGAFQPRVAFALAPDARAPIADFLQSTASVISDAPDLYLATALQGAYASLRARPATPAGGPERKAVVVVSNRDLTSGPCPGGTPVELASAALASDDITTYAVALADGDLGAVDTGRALAEAGGTRVFDGVSDQAEGAQAMQEILTELGTCLYQPQTLAADAVPADARVSYLDATFGQVDIEHNPACRDGADVPGWNLDAGRVRVCGADCTALRDHVNLIALRQALEQRAAPPVPMVLTAPCQ